MTKTQLNEEWTKNTDRAIAELVYDKTQMIKAYNYYHGKRDPEQFRHLEENYGLGTPTAVEFVPLVRKHVDVLVGEYLSIPLLPRISCKDRETISYIHRDKQLAVHKEVVQTLKKHLNNVLYSELKESQKPIPDHEIEQELQRTIQATDSNFISDYEIAGQNIVDWSLQSRVIDFLNKRKTMLIDLLVSGTTYYKPIKTAEKDHLRIKVLNPLHTFIDRNPESPYLKDSARAVCREYLTRDQILATYGHLLSDEDIEELNSMVEFGINGPTTYLRSFNTIVNNTTTDGILGGYEITPLFPYDNTTSTYFKVIPVYDVEWLETKKEKGKLITRRYNSIRIGASLYIHLGVVEDAVKQSDSLYGCSLSVNGMFYADRNGEPLSLILATANLQDKYDVLCFFRDNVIAESGTVGDWVDVAYLPKVLGSDLTERLMKWKAYKKQGLAIIDSSQEGLPPMNTTFGGYDDTIKLQTIEAIELAIQSIENTCSTITGVFREKLGGIEQRDAVSNVQLGVRQSTYITKQYYYTMDLLTREMLLDILNLAKIVFKKGLYGTLILGDRLTKVFTALPEHFTMTDYDIHVADSSEILKEQELMKQLAVEFIKSKVIAPEIILEVVTASGLTKMKKDVLASIAVQKQENNQLGQLTQQVEQLNQELKNVSGEAQKLQQQVQSLNAEKLALEKEKLQFTKELEWFKARTDSSYKESQLEWEKKRVDLEGLQLLDNSRRNDEIKNE